MRSFQENLRLYAKLAVRVGVNVQPNQELIVGANTRDLQLTRLVVEEAYHAGAKHVFVHWTDEICQLAKYQHATPEALDYAPDWLYAGMANAMKDGAARLSLYGEDPALLKDVPADRISRHTSALSTATRPVGDMISGFDINWSLVGSAHPEWAKKVFPGLEETHAVAKLWDAIFLASHVLEPDPVASWQSHCDDLAQRRQMLNDLQLTELRFRGPGTELNVGLADNHAWQGGWGEAKNGVRCAPNIPTEEVFTMPHRLKTNGKVRSTKPLSLRGRVIEGIEMEFKDGKVVHASAASGEETLLGLLNTDDGARHLGEVALVPITAKVAQTNLLFLNTLYDENAASHIALGRCYAENMNGYNDLTKEQRREAGANDSNVHEDWMIGSAEVDVDGVLPSGEIKPLMRGGLWSS